MAVIDLFEAALQGAGVQAELFGQGFESQAHEARFVVEGAFDLFDQRLALRAVLGGFGLSALGHLLFKPLGRLLVQHGEGATQAVIEQHPIAAATVKGTGNDLALTIDYTTKTGYPIVLVTYEITCEKGGDAALVPLTKSFLTYTSGDEAQGKLSTTGYVPITGDVLTKVRAAVASIS